jgi:hypothetical protein
VNATWCQPLPDNQPGHPPPLTTCPGDTPGDYPEHTAYTYRVGSGVHHVDAARPCWPWPPEAAP